MSKLFLNPQRAAEIDRQKLLTDIDAWFDTQLAAGYTVPGRNFRLGLRQEDVTLLTGAFVLAKEAAVLGLNVPPIIDMDGIPRELGIEDLTAVMLGYGQYRATLSAEYAARKAAIAT
jgi:hypothetical protein